MNRAGDYVDNLTGESLYRSFRPAPLPPEPALEIENRTLNLLIEANRNLAELKTASRLIVNTDLFVSMYVRKEALISSQIEGTQCTLEDVLDPGIDTNTNIDVADVINYVNATQKAMDLKQELPLCNRLIKEVHAVLMNGVRGKDKNPGEFRRSQNWIGSSNSSIKDARFVPPNVQDMIESMSALEKYINDNIEYDPLIRTALIHYQFETIHPFLDGNGRIGRLLILLYLIDQKLLSKPVIYISYFLKKNQVEYYDRISEVRRQGNYEQWIHFFLEAVNAAAIDSIKTIESMQELHNQNTIRLPSTNRRSNNIRVVFNYLEQHPIIDIGKTAKELNLSYNTVSSVVKKLTQLKILTETTNASRNRIFVYEDYLSLLREGT
ncbi:MAG: Fic family protein [Eubacteriales bacterium]|nr:Fic family protein [Eubacteriales bacterium]